MTGKPLIESDRVEGTYVYDPSDNHIGTIKRLMIDKVSGQVRLHLAHAACCSPLQRLDEGDHAPALIRVGQATAHCAEIVHMCAGLLVPGMTAVTRGSASRNLRKRRWDCEPGRQGNHASRATSKDFRLMLV
jgi:hypothetical protein